LKNAPHIQKLRGKKGGGLLVGEVCEALNVIKLRQAIKPSKRGKEKKNFSREVLRKKKKEQETVSTPP